MLIANKVIDLMQKSGRSDVVFKVDFRKAYDSVDLGFLVRVLKEMRFGERWCKWISKYISIASISVLVNDSPTERFQLVRGLRQEYYSLSLLLFNLVGEVLNLMIEKAVNAGLISGCLVGCLVGSLPSNYLGLPLGAHRNSRLMWGPVIEKVHNRLAGWKSISLSFGDKKENHWMWWTDVCKPMELGCLSFVDLKLKNFSLLENWCWRFCSMPLSLWKQTLSAKAAILFPNLKPHVVSWIWHGISSTYYGASEGFCLKDLFQLQVGDVSDIRFWQDRWLEKRPLKEMFPRIYALALNKEGTIAEFAEMRGADPVLNSFVSSSSASDWVKRLGSSDGIYSVKSVSLLKYPSGLENLAANLALTDDALLKKKKKVAKSLPTWLPPSRGSLKFNVDGAMRLDGGGEGISGILRDLDGTPLLTFSVPIGCGSSMQAEILAVDHAIKLFMGSRWFKAFDLIIECDCAVMVN
ncbi:hypothetical protein F3Y22_tig00016212pilonHSYRG00068 [Hibiscus syriacus]|uniref:RNase H type-1 domain-containing protein n=1 Tax=Hibiscus syriacus TaxID=106335 RepID=A0A6A3BXC1_HIBSY|nr:hypothetical protein F3Y22_tig00016212pilonHSYRG00068 [Hibiscus syriacus]